jgi:hypothetical protein
MSCSITARRAPVPAVRQLLVTESALPALAARVPQLHEPAPAFEQVQTRHALPPVQSRGVPPVQLPAPLQVWPTVQKSGLQGVLGGCGL